MRGGKEAARVDLFGAAPVAGRPCNIILYNTQKRGPRKQIVVRHDTGAVESVVPKGMLPEIREAAGLHYREYKDGDDLIVEFSLRLDGLVEFEARVDDKVRETRRGRRDQILMGQNDIMANGAELDAAADRITFSSGAGTAKVVSL